MEGNILVAHRSEQVLEAVKEMLQNQGYAVTPATAGPQALAKAMSGRFHLIIIGRNLTGSQDGLWLVERLRKYGIQTPIIGTASKDAWAYPAGAAPAKIDRFLPSSFASQDLIDAVRSFFHRTRTSVPNGPAPLAPPAFFPTPEKPGESRSDTSTRREPPRLPGKLNGQKILRRTSDRKWEPRTPPRPQGAPRILLVDTHEAARCRVAQTLSQAGYEVTRCKNGQEAYETTMLNDFELILTDLWLVGMDGFEMIKALRKSGVTAAIGVLTAYITRDMVRELRPWKIRKILLKPVDTDTLLSFVKDTAPSS